MSDIKFEAIIIELIKQYDLNKRNDAIFVALYDVMFKT